MNSFFYRHRKCSGDRFFYAGSLEMLPTNQKAFWCSLGARSKFIFIHSLFFAIRMIPFMCERDLLQSFFIWDINFKIFPLPNGSTVRRSLWFFAPALCTIYTFLLYNLWRSILPSLLPRVKTIFLCIIWHSLYILR